MGNKNFEKDKIRFKNKLWSFLPPALRSSILVLFMIGSIILFFKHFLSSPLNSGPIQFHFGPGDTVGHDKIVNEVKKFSSNQSIRLWPERLGGSFSLDLDNLASLTYLTQIGETGIKLSLNSSFVEIPSPVPGNNVIKTKENEFIVNPLNNPRFEIKDFSVAIPDNNPTYEFDAASQKVQYVEINKRRFTVTLNKIIKQNIPLVSSAVEYDFGISED